MYTNKKLNWLRITTAAIAICAVGPIQAEGKKVWASGEAGILSMSPIGSAGDGLSMPTGAIELGVHLKNSPYSISFGMRRFSDSDSEETQYSSEQEGSEVYTYENSNAVSGTVLDFEVGRDVQLGGNSTGRVTLGVRNFDVENRNEYSYTGSYSTDTRFEGTGPRIALETSTPVSEKLSLDVEAGLAVLFGSTTITTGSDGDVYSIYTQDNTVKNLDFSAALSYLIAPKAKISIGVRADIFSGLTQGYDDSKISTTGAFLKFTTEF